MPGISLERKWEGILTATIDLLARALVCRQYFREDPEIRQLATLLYGRYDFVWRTNGDGKLLAHGWRPEGFIKFRYYKYSQLAAMYLLGVGSPTHPLPPEAWYVWERDPTTIGNTTISVPPCFVGVSILLPGSIFAGGGKIVGMFRQM